MKAALLKAPRQIEVEDLPDPEPPEGWVLVRSRAVGICGTDKAFYRGTYPLFKQPLIPGHEVSGVVVEGSKDLIGLNVVSEINFACWSCPACRSGFYTHCPRKKTLGIDFDGGMAEYFIAPATAIHPHNIKHEVAFAAEPLAAVLNALNMRPPKRGWSVAVIGTGFIAFLAAQVVRLQGFEPIIVGRVDSPKKAVFARMGFEVLDFEEAMERGKRTWSRLGFDMVIEATGSNEGVKAAVALARPRGVVHLKSTPGGLAEFPQTLAVVKELELVGSRCGTFREFREALRLLEEGMVKIPITAEYSLEEAREAFERSLGRDAIKVLVKP